MTHIQRLSHQSRQRIAGRTGVFLLLLGIVGIVGSRSIGTLTAVDAGIAIDCGFFRDVPLPSGQWEPYSPELNGVETFWPACVVQARQRIIISSVTTAVGTQERFYKGYEQQVEVDDLALSPG